MASLSCDELVAGVRSRKRRAIARAISLIENEHPLGIEVARQVFRDTSQGDATASAPHACRVIGVTGPPGVGKSTLVDKLALELVSHGERVGVLAIDPTSPFSGGALLGDRIRMADASASDAVFIRSMATRGGRGGLARTTHDVVTVLGAAGYTTVLLETVGVGQIEVEVALVADLTLLVLMPGTGDLVQALKAGIAEVANFFVINKSDLPGADLLESILRQALGMERHEDRAKGERQIVRLSAAHNEGIALLRESLMQFSWDSLRGQQRARSEALIYRLIEERIARSLPLLAHEMVTAGAGRCLARHETPSDVAESIVGKLFPSCTDRTPK